MRRYERRQGKAILAYNPSGSFSPTERNFIGYSARSSMIGVSPSFLLCSHVRPASHRRKFTCPENVPGLLTNQDGQAMGITQFLIPCP